MSFNVVVTYTHILKRHIHTSIISWWHSCRLGRTIFSRRGTHWVVWKWICVCMWQEELNLRSGDASLNACTIRHASCMLCAWKALRSLTRKWNSKVWWYGSLWIVGWEFWFESHVHSCVGDVKRCFVQRIRFVVCVFDCVECVWQLGSLRSVRLSTSSPGRSFGRWSFGWKPAICSVARVSCSAVQNVHRRRQTH